MRTGKLIVLGTALLTAMALLAAHSQAQQQTQPTLQAPDESTLWTIGTAWTPDQSAVLYYEYHFAENPDLQLSTRVQYRRADGSVFAEKTIDYSRSLTAPDIQHIDYRNTARITTELTDDSRAAMIKVGFQAHDSPRYREELLAHRESVVVDAGFDPFVRKHWQSLITGESVSAGMLVPSRLDTVRVSLTKADASHCDQASTDVYCFVIRPAGMLRAVGWLVDPIYIGYDQQSQRLKIFYGISNLRDDDGDPQNVLITFEYFQNNQTASISNGFQEG